MSGPIPIDPAMVKDSLEKVLPIGDGAAPTTVVAWKSRTGLLARLRADYPNGFRLTVYFDKRGNPSSAKASCSMAVRGKKA